MRNADLIKRELSERLVGKTPEGLDRCFYADNGCSDIDLSTRDQAPRPQCA